MACVALRVAAALLLSTIAGNSARADPVRVAFVGNSYTYFNNLPATLANLSASANLTLTHAQSTPGGTSLFEHANASTATGAATAALLAPGAAFDFVVLQDQSETPGGGRDTDAHLALGLARNLSLAAMQAFYAPSLRSLAGAGATALLYSTWGRRDPAVEDPLNADVYPNFNTMNTRTSAGYQLYGAALRAAGAPSVRTAPVGRAYEIVHDETPAPLAPGSAFDALFHSGRAGVGGHPSVLGTYLIANVFFGVISGAEPKQATWRPSGVSAAQQQYLQGVAGRAVSEHAGVGGVVGAPSCTRTGAECGASNRTAPACCNGTTCQAQVVCPSGVPPAPGSACGRDVPASQCFRCAAPPPPPEPKGCTSAVFPAAASNCSTTPCCRKDGNGCLTYLVCGADAQGDKWCRKMPPPQRTP